MRVRLLPQALLMGALLTAAGCHVQVDKANNGDDKNVRIDTPLGGLHVRSDETAAADLGLPVYPGAHVAPDKDGDKSADVHLGFGQWQLRVRVVTYSTSDAQDKVLAFYRGAMGRFGTVIECDGNHAVGTPSVTTEGLGCDEQYARHNVHVSGIDDDNGMTLRAGSRRHQHILAIKNGDGGTRFSLVELELPADLDHEPSRSSD